MWLETMSGLNINLEKSELFPIRQVSNLRIFVGTLGCKVGTLLSTYLRLLLGASFKSSRVWNGVEERFWRRLAMWKRQYLSKGGRLTLVKHFVQFANLLYVSFCHPKEGSCQIGKDLKEVFVGIRGFGSKVALGELFIICLEKQKGGLGIRDLSILNEALLGKWSWRFVRERNPLWKRVIVGKYGQVDGGWCSKEVREGHGVEGYKRLMRDFQDLNWV